MVYVIDDEKCIADTLGTILRRQGYRTAVFYEALTALRYLRYERPSVIICDLVLTNSSGLSFLEAALTRFPDAACILFTGILLTSELIAEIKRLGKRVMIISKPAHPNELLACVLWYLSQQRATKKCFSEV